LIAVSAGVVGATILFFGGSIQGLFTGSSTQTASTGTNTAVQTGTSTSSTTTMQNISKTKGLEIYDEVVGTGAEAQAGQNIQAHYVGTLLNGTKFDSSVDRGQPFEFTLGVGQVIQGWDLGIQGMKVGGKRKLVISPELAYGSRGAGNLIPPNSTLVFEVQLMGIQK
jgi:FKBP-type peptidyl-prolyl cis-trans isomerase